MLIVRKLDITKDYKIVSQKHLVDDVDTCENCGRIITNVITLKDDAGNLYNVGTECVKMINKFANTWDGVRELKQAEKNLKNESKFHNWVNKKAAFKNILPNGIYELFDADKKNCYKCNINMLDAKIVDKIQKLENYQSVCFIIK